MNHAFQQRLPAAIATLTILAMFIAPLCGALCATPSHCPVQIAAAQSDTNSCHHATMAGNADALGIISAAMTCAQSETIAITPNETNPLSRTDRTSTLESSLATTQHEIPTLAAIRASLRVTKTESPSTNTLAHYTILRI